MSKRNLIIFVLLAAAIAAVIWFLKPCGPKTSDPVPVQTSIPTPPPSAPALQPPPAKPGEPVKKAAVEPVDKTPPVEKNVPPAVHEVDTAPPVNLTGSEEIPNVARCATANFPAEAKAFVKTAIVTVRLVVDKFGNVRSDTPISVEFPQEVEEDQLPAMRKLFIKAGARAFGAKKCPPHLVNGQAVGYAIEVPLQYKH